jgi:hypothetical protein
LESKLQNRNVATAAGFGGKPPQKPTLEITKEWINSGGGNLIAKLEVTNHRWHQVLCDCSLVRTKKGGYWVFPPSAVGKDGGAIIDDKGKVTYRPCVIWVGDAGKRFSEAVIAAFRAKHPGMLEETGS